MTTRTRNTISSREVNTRTRRNKKHFGGLFPAGLSQVLVKEGAVDIKALAKLSGGSMKKALEKSPLSRTDASFHESRLKRFQKLVKNGEKPENINGLKLDLPDKVAISINDLNKLKAAKIDSLDAWISKRGKVKISANGAADMDKYARFYSLRVDTSTAAKLAGLGYDSAASLANLSTRDIASLAKIGKIKSGTMASIVGRAQTQNAFTNTYLTAVDIYVNDNLPGSIHDLVIRNPALTCIPCAEDESAFSCFAYYVYLIQKTQLSITVVNSKLNLGIDLRTLSPLAKDQLMDDPKAPCAKISKLDYVIRLLQELLEQLRRDAQDPSTRTGFQYLDYPTWRAEKIAATYPETKALWQNDVLTSIEIDEEQGSILLDHAESRHTLLTQIELAKEAINNAKIDTGDSAVSDNKFKNTLGDFTDEPFYVEYLHGLSLLEDIISIDDLTQEAHIAGQNYEHGIALSKLEQANQLIDLVVADVFPDDSAWHHPDHNRLLTYSDLIATSPINKKELLQQAFEDLMFGRKKIFQPRVDNLNVDGLLENGGIDISNPRAWTIDPGFSQNSSDEIEFEINSQENSARKIVYTRGHGDDDFDDYGVGFDFEITEGTADNLAIEIRDQNITPEFYRLRIHPQVASDEEIAAAEAAGDNDFLNFVAGVGEFFFDEDEGLGGYYQYLVLEKIMIGNVETLSKSFIGYSQRVDHDASTIHPGVTYRLSMEVDGPELIGRLVKSSTEIIEVNDTDNRFDKGTFALSVPSYITGKIWNFELFINSNLGLPPFHASNQRAPFTSEPRMSLMSSVHGDHGNFGHGMSDKLLAGLFVTQSIDNDKVQLHGATRVNKDLYMVFRSGTNKVEPNNINKTLHRALAQLVFLRFAVIPTRMAQAYFQAGEYERSAELLRLLYDDTDQDWFDDLGMQIYPIFSQPPEAFEFGVSPDTRLMRLRLAETYLAQGEALFRSDSKDSRYRACRLFERVIELHGANCDCESRIGEITEDLVEIVISAGPSVIRKPGRLDNPDMRAVLTIIRDHGQQIANLDKLLDDFRKDANTEDDSKFAAAAKKLLRKLESELAKLHKRSASELVFEKVVDRAEQILLEAELQAIALGITKNGKHANIFGGVIHTGQRRLHSSTRTERVFNYPAFCVPQNPLISQQVNQACLMIQLLKNCFNILGFKDDFVPPFRFEALLNIANEFAQKAQSAERDLINFKQLFEQESFALMQAEQNLALSNADVSLEALNVDLAASNQTISVLQAEQASRARQHYTDLIAAGLNDSEKAALFTAVAAASFSGLATIGSSVSGIAGVVSAIANPLGTVTDVVSAGGDLASGTFSGLATTSSLLSNAYSMQASYERREEEWKFNEIQSQFSEIVAQINVIQSEKRLTIAKSRQEISLMRRDFSLDSVNFLSNKFMNGAMYAWMIKTIREQYRTRLNYAIAAAYMAERALAFEVQNSHLDIIRFDYFNPSKDGLLGATQLLTDLSTLQNTHFRLATRKLQLSKTLSLSQLFPVEFAKFKQTGVIPFSTSKGELGKWPKSG